MIMRDGIYRRELEMIWSGHLNQNKRHTWILDKMVSIMINFKSIKIKIKCVNLKHLTVQGHPMNL